MCVPFAYPYIGNDVETCIYLYWSFQQWNESEDVLFYVLSMHPAMLLKISELKMTKRLCIIPKAF